MKKIISFCFLLFAVASLLYAATLDSDVTFDAPIARPSVAAIRVRFIQVNYDQQTAEAFYTVAGNGGQLNSAILFEGDDFANFPQPGNTFSNLLLRASVKLKQMAATNGISLK